MGVQAMDSDEENDELLERLPWGVWRCCDETAPIYGREYDTVSELKQALATATKVEAKDWAELVGVIAYGELGPPSPTMKSNDAAEVQGDAAEVAHALDSLTSLTAGDADTSAWDVMQKVVVAEAAQGDAPPVNGHVYTGGPVPYTQTAGPPLHRVDTFGQSITASAKAAARARTGATSRPASRPAALPASSCLWEEADECVVVGARSREERDAALRRSAVDVEAYAQTGPASVSTEPGAPPPPPPPSDLSVERVRLSRSIRFYGACARLDSALGTEEVRLPRHDEAEQAQQEDPQPYCAPPPQVLCSNAAVGTQYTFAPHPPPSPSKLGGTQQALQMLAQQAQQAQQAPPTHLQHCNSLEPRETLFAVIRPEMRSPARSPEVEMQLRCNEQHESFNAVLREVETQLRPEVQSPARSPEVEAILDEAIAMNTFPLAPYPEALQSLQPALFSQLRLTSTKALRPSPVRPSAAQRPSPLCSTTAQTLSSPLGVSPQQNRHPLSASRGGDERGSLSTSPMMDERRGSTEPCKVICTSPFASRSSSLASRRRVGMRPPARGLRISEMVAEVVQRSSSTGSGGSSPASSPASRGRSSSLLGIAKGQR